MYFYPALYIHVYIRCKIEIYFGIFQRRWHVVPLYLLIKTMQIPVCRLSMSTIRYKCINWGQALSSAHFSKCTTPVDINVHYMLLVRVDYLTSVNLNVVIFCLAGEEREWQGGGWEWGINHVDENVITPSADVPLDILWWWGLQYTFRGYFFFQNNP